MTNTVVFLDRTLLEKLAPQKPLVDGEFWFCQHCKAGSQHGDPRQPNEDPATHEADCAWVAARGVLERDRVRAEARKLSPLGMDQEQHNAYLARQKVLATEQGDEGDSFDWIVIGDLIDDNMVLCFHRSANGDYDLNASYWLKGWMVKKLAEGWA